jgi:hypothetical protein
MTQPLFRVVFDGSLTGDFEVAVAKKRFSRLFNLDAKRTEKFFSGKSFVIKNNISEEEAMIFMIKVSEAGCECSLQEITDEDELYYDEKRVGEERRVRFRRSPRAGARTMDRRTQIRRKIDKTEFGDLIQNSKKIPVAFKSYTTNPQKK